jgi:exodeoxyribonuclease V alpha subunit
VEVAVVQEPHVVEGVVRRLVHVGTDGYTVAVIAVDDTGEVTIAGACLRGLQPGETIRAVGRGVSRSRYAGTMRVSECERVLPATVHAIRCYLGSGLVRGIGSKLADAIVRQFGADTLTVIEQAPRKLLDVHLIGPGRLATITASWAEQRTIREVMMFLQGVGVSPTLAVRIHKKLGTDTLRVVRKEPYRLVEEVHGIGFINADKIALAVGIPTQSVERMKAALLHVLDEAQAKAGHCYLPYGTTVSEAVKLVGENPELLRNALHQLRKARKVVLEQAPESESDLVVFPAGLHRSETMLVENIQRLQNAASTLMARPRAAAVFASEPAATERERLDDRQRAAVQMALAHPVSILTGGPGCGKSFTLRAIATRVQDCGGRVTLAAPTGRAAKRLSELTRLPAMTVHRLVRPPTNTDAVVSLFDVTEPLQADLIIVDEASMLDLRLAEQLVAGMPGGSHLLLVGDVDQLPSIGPGCVLRDLLDVASIPSVRLDQIYRQGPRSAISTSAHAVRHGSVPASGGDFWFIPVDDPSKMPAEVVDIATRRLPTTYGVDPRQVQVLCPGRTTTAGALAIGRLIQDKLNPHTDGEPQHWTEDQAFRVGDKVMPVRNNYTKGKAGVFNGSAGTVTGLDADERSLTITLDDGEAVTYDFDELDEITHAYAITVHRSQGSEYPYVVVALSNAAGQFLLQRNLLYTAITRARTMVVIVGPHAAYDRAIRTRAKRRNTRLSARFDEIPGQMTVTVATPNPDGQISAF